MKRILAASILIIASASGGAAPLNAAMPPARVLSPTAGYSEPFSANCRITTSMGQCGSGVAIGSNASEVLVLTNAHVAKTSSLTAEFWHRGHKSAPILGRIVDRSETLDLAVVAVPLSSFGQYKPTIYPIDFSHQHKKGETVLSVGCANGGWQTMFEGHIRGLEGDAILFDPPPAEGRSGSALLNATGTKLIGLVYEREERNGDMWGRAIPPAKIAAALGLTAQRFQTQYCGPGTGRTCPAPNLPKYNLNLRGTQEFVYPELPSTAGAASTFDPSGLQAQITALDARIRNLEGLNTDVAGNAGTVEELKNKLAALEGKPDPTIGLDGKIGEKVTETLEKKEGTWLGKIKDMIPGVIWKLIAPFGWPATIIALVVGFFVYRKLDTNKNWKLEVSEIVAPFKKMKDRGTAWWDRRGDGDYDRDHGSIDVTDQTEVPLDRNHPRFHVWAMKHPEAVVKWYPDWKPPQS